MAGRQRFKRKLEEFGAFQTIGPATLGTGTPTDRTFLRGDGTWAGVTALYTQTAYSTATRTQSNPAQSAVATTGATDSAPFGFSTAAQANDLIAQLNSARADILNIKQVLNSVIDDLQAVGILQ